MFASGHRLGISRNLISPSSRLQDKSTRLQEISTQHQGILPIDILQQIFIASLPTTHNAVMSKREPPILLTQVCSSWRNIAHATPQLWKSIHIAVPCNTRRIRAIEYPNSQSTMEQVAHRRSEAVLEWISRSATCPLDISLSQWQTSAPDGFYEKMIEYLIPFSERWRTISFLAPYQALIPVAALPTSKVPLLESLYLNCCRPHFTPPPIHPYLDRRSLWINSGIMKAPKLREIRLTQLNDDASRLPINWSQLTHLSLHGTIWGGHASSSVSVLNAYKIFSSCHNLIICRLEIGTMTEFDKGLSETSPPISLPFLTKLSVREDTQDFYRLFNLVHLPSLETLEFHTSIWPSPGSRTGLLSLLLQSHITIQHLITDAQFFNREDFINCLRLCPSLKSLAIRKDHAITSPPPQLNIPTCSIDDAFLNMFTSDQADSAIFEDPLAGGCLCPNLEHFESSSKITFSETTLLQFIRRKNGEPSISGLAKLKSLLVVFYHRPLNDINPELELYKQEGLEATILYAVPSYPCLPPLTSPFLHSMDWLVRIDCNRGKVFL